MYRSKLGNFGRYIRQYEKARRPYPKEVFIFLESLLKNKKPKILDLGCGTGISTRQLVSLGEVVGCDPDIRMLKAAKLHKKTGVKKYVLGSAEKLPFKNGIFDVVTAFASFHWFNNRKALVEIKRVLKPNGIFFVVNQGGAKNWGQGYRKAIIKAIDKSIPNFKTADYHPLRILRKGGFKKIIQKNWGKSELYNQKNVLEYIQSVSIWNTVPENLKQKALLAVKEHFKSVLKKRGKIERIFKVRAKVAIK